MKLKKLPEGEGFTFPVVQWVLLDDVLGQRRALPWGFGMGKGTHVTEAITGPYGWRAFLLPRKGAVYRHVLIGICTMFGER